MKKGLRGFLIAVAVVFGLLVVMAVLGNTVFSDAEPKKEQAEVPSTATNTTTTPDQTASRAATKGSELLIRLNESGTIGGLLFEDGTYIAVDSMGGLYKRISVNKEGKCFAFSIGYNSSRTATVELKPGLVVFYEVGDGGFYFYIYREHVMKGIPIILLPDKWPIDHTDGYEVTVRSEDPGTDFTFSGKSGRDKIVKIPVAGAKSIG
ncbi:MAG: hypothetical protein CVV51_08345 [Spirochaetae bacterium HGW-Spirochaetae-7]|jgi:hypothetical protein|nr:MAG: hypothetical protein CVV51_08345 [Spirochaetae bacterium HGW-Spirochaetae-7]